ncbi:hypothetical protein [Mycobacterium sp.]|uniref:hypothetical protein n=1 Tax=Mycobacterium sp. TaxID=1785 RepID=UPI003C741EFF
MCAGHDPAEYIQLKVWQPPRVILHLKCRVDNFSNGGLDDGTGPSSSRFLVEKWAARLDESSGKEGFSVDAKPIAQVADELGMTNGAGWAEESSRKKPALDEHRINYTRPAVSFHVPTTLT